MVRWVKNLVLSLLWLWLQLWHRFDPWPRNFHMLQAKKKKKKERKQPQVNFIFFFVPFFLYFSHFLVQTFIDFKIRR